MSLKDLFSGDKAHFFWYNILGMFIFCVVIILVALKGLDFYTAHGKGTVVPNLVGMKVDEAKILLNNHNLNGIVVDSVYNKNKPAGIIMEQNPISGSNVKGGRTIYLTINTGASPILTLPDIADNSSVREAEAKLLAAGFILGPSEIKGDKINADDPIVLQVGSGSGIIGEGGEMDMTESDTTTTKPTKAPDKTVVDDSWF
jgi:beta-lactam-binding protein with PASTA domain